MASPERQLYCITQGEIPVQVPVLPTWEQWSILGLALITKVTSCFLGKETQVIEQDLDRVLKMIGIHWGVEHNLQKGRIITALDVNWGWRPLTVDEMKKEAMSA
ncbi:hypothetical protein A2164_00125 [Candidatus Curtissbacteria bacterium RBG_13_35_7]|uniref:Uncharacterized protein n=1 Tax=Candidatus Curtissbacteria bacterium RBG_13_35_7 TaxID=1797705 RepID=A0A1F5G5C3_9BACT|nr:MAG: hypothetical protein A2164_00125 [Candidatus Curtissbacteria bacterium RBG_13_35_7]